MALYWPVLTATQVGATNGNGDTSTGVRDPQRHQWIKADWLCMTTFCCFSLFVVCYCSFMILYVYLYLVVFIVFLLFCSSQAVLQNQEICEFQILKGYIGCCTDHVVSSFLTSGGFPINSGWFWIPVSKSRKSFWFQAQGRWGQGLWFILVLPMQTLSSRYKSLRMQDNSRTKAWEKEWKKMLSILFTHRSPQHATASHDTLNHKHAVHRFRQTLSSHCNEHLLTFT